MKQIACAEMGGPKTCDFMVAGNTAEELVKNGMDHVTQAHPDLGANIKKMTPEETTKWMEDFKLKFDAAPQM